MSAPTKYPSLQCKCGWSSPATILGERKAREHLRKKHKNQMKQVGRKTRLTFENAVDEVFRTHFRGQ